MIEITQEIIGSGLRIGTPIALAALGELVTEKSGVLNLGIEGIMYGSAFVGIAVAAQTGSLTTGLIAALFTGAAAGLIFAVLTVTLGVNQHVAGLGLTLLMISFSNSANRIMFTADGGQVRVNPWQPFNIGGPIFSQYWMTYATFLIAVPATWWLMWRSGLGLKIRAVGENPEAADVAGIGVTKTRYIAIIIGSLYMAAGGAFITLAFVGTFTINIINGRGWIALALVIFGRWKIGRLLAGVALFSLVNAGQLQLRLLPSFSDVPFEILLALPYLGVIIGLAISGRNVPYPGAYLKPYKRL